MGGSTATADAARSEGRDPGKLGWSATVADITPGTYQFTHHSGERGFDRDVAETVIFAHFERIA
jgi:hypothetical protein